MNSFLTIMLFVTACAGASILKIESPTSAPAPQPLESSSVEYDGWDGCDPSLGICYSDLI